MCSPDLLSRAGHRAKNVLQTVVVVSLRKQKHSVVHWAEKPLSDVCSNGRQRKENGGKGIEFKRKLETWWELKPGLMHASWACISVPLWLLGSSWTMVAVMNALWYSTQKTSATSTPNLILYNGRGVAWHVKFSIRLTAGWMWWAWHFTHPRASDGDGGSRCEKLVAVLPVYRFGCSVQLGINALTLVFRCPQTFSFCSCSLYAHTIVKVSALSAEWSGDWGALFWINPDCFVLLKLRLFSTFK